ncbi:MAG: aminoglycoside phosphotransferase family protein [Armatimonas sp.]
MLPWTQPDWQEEAHAWIRTEMERLHLPISGPIEQPHILPWSTVMHFRSGEETLYFKATAEYEGYETAVTAALSRWQPGYGPEVLAVDTERSWMLMRDIGVTLRAVLKENPDPRHWTTILTQYARQQQESLPKTAEFLNLGVPDRRLARLPSLLTEFLADSEAILLDQPGGMNSAEREQFYAFVPRFARLCERLAVLGIPETLDHNDLHANNVFVSADGRYTVGDWGDCCVTHPFSVLTVVILSVGKNLGWAEDGPEVAALRADYLAEWETVASREAIQEAARLIPWVGLLNRALTWKLVLFGMPESQRGQFGASCPDLLREVLKKELPEGY